jgi:hypothetical protein
MVTESANELSDKPAASCTSESRTDCVSSVMSDKPQSDNDTSSPVISGSRHFHASKESICQNSCESLPVAAMKADNLVRPCTSVGSQSMTSNVSSAVSIVTSSNVKTMSSGSPDKIAVAGTADISSDQELARCSRTDSPQSVNSISDKIDSSMPAAEVTSAGDQIQCEVGNDGSDQESACSTKLATDPMSSLDMVCDDDSINAASPTSTQLTTNNHSSSRHSSKRKARGRPAAKTLKRK